MSTKQTFTYPFSINNREDYGQVLKEIDDKINLFKKRVSYFDAFHISGSVVDEKQLDAQLSSLPVNQSLVINTSPFIKQSTIYAPGDILLKMSNGEIVRIPSQTGGVYYPRSVTPQMGTGDNKDKVVGYTVEYSYSGSAPTNDEPSEKDWTKDRNEDGVLVADFKEQIIFKNLEKIEKNSIYGLWQKVTNTTVSFNAYYTSISEGSMEYPIYPFLQFFLCKQVDGETTPTPDEQVYLEYNLELNDKVWTATIDGWTIPADSESELWVKVK